MTKSRALHPLPETARKFAALVAYRGTQFCGWQKQKGSAAEGLPSIQATVEAALTRITGETTTVVGSGRTDSGVHATGQVTHFLLRGEDRGDRPPWDPAILKKGLNSQLPPDIRVVALRPIAIDFHAQHSAEMKQYSYYFQQGPSALPHLEPYSWWIRKRLDLEAMNRGLAHLIGEHDFKPFQSSGAKPGPTRRRIIEAAACWEPIAFPGEVSDATGVVRVRIRGTGFLKQMVRGISGTLLQVGEGRRDPDCFGQILASGDRSAVGPTAPGRALWLERVWYPERYGLDW